MNHSIRNFTCLAAAAGLLAACVERGAPGPAATGDVDANQAPEEVTMASQRLQDHYGTTWQLVRIQSMDDTVTEPDERAKYTVTFEEGGDVVVRADCNRGRGSFSSGSAGELEFGPLATTRAMCPPGSISDRFLSELGYVRSYVLEDGTLHLATMADGSIIDFEPMEAD